MKQKQAVIYARFSPRRKADECESCEKQIDFCTNYCIFHKLEVLSIYRDDGISGANYDKRPGVQEAIAGACKHKAILLVYSLSRLARNTRETIEIVERLHKAKANIASVTESIDTSTAMGNMFFQLIAIFAELNRRQISETTSAAMRYHQSKGRRMSKTCPFGWRSDPDDLARMLPDETELAVIEKIKELRKGGLSYRGVCDELSQLGYVPRPVQKMFQGVLVEVKGKWHHGTIRHILARAELDVF